jgi:hypothetical protein
MGGKLTLIEEVEHIVRDANVSYPQSYVYCLLLEIQVLSNSLITTWLNYMSSTKPPGIGPQIPWTGTTQFQVKVLQAKTVMMKHDYVVVMEL